MFINNVCSLGNCATYKFFRCYTKAPFPRTNEIQARKELNFLKKFLKDGQLNDVESKRFRYLGRKFSIYAIEVYICITNPVQNMSHLYEGCKKLRNQLGKETKEEAITHFRVPEDLMKRLQNLNIHPKHWNISCIENVHELDDDVLKLLMNFREKIWHQSDQFDIKRIHTLIGMYLMKYGERQTLLLMTWLGCKVLPIEHDSQAGSRYGEWKNPASTINVDDKQKIRNLLLGYSALENKIDYRFKDATLLLEAVTHDTFKSNTITSSNRRMALLGDGVLHYIIAKHLFESPKHFDHFQCSRIQIYLECNASFSNAVVRNDLHKYLRYIGNDLNCYIRQYLMIQKAKNFKIDPDVIYFYLIDQFELIFNSEFVIYR